MFTAIAKAILYVLWTACTALYWAGYAAVWAIDLLKYPLHPYVLVPLVVLCYSVYYFRITEKDIQYIFEPRQIDTVTPADIEVLIIQQKSLVSAVAAYLLKDRQNIQVISIYRGIPEKVMYDIKNKVVFIVGFTPNSKQLTDICNKAAKVVILDNSPIANWPTLTEHYKSRKLVNLLTRQTPDTPAQALWKFLRPNVAEPIMITYMDNTHIPLTKYVHEYLMTNFRTVLDISDMYNFIEGILKYGGGGVTIHDLTAHFKNPAADKKHLPKPLYDMVRLIKQGKTIYDMNINMAKQLPFNIQTVTCNGLRYTLCVAITIEPLVHIVCDTIIAGTLEKSLADPIVASVMYYDILTAEWVITYVAADKTTNVMPFVGITDPNMFSNHATIYNNVPLRYMP